MLPGAAAITLPESVEDMRQKTGINAFPGVLTAMVAD